MSLTNVLGSLPHRAEVLHEEAGITSSFTEPALSPLVPISHILQAWLAPARPSGPEFTPLLTPALAICSSGRFQLLASAPCLQFRSYHILEASAGPSTPRSGLTSPALFTEPG